MGVLGLSWCRMDSNLLLSAGKDNRVLCWNPRDGDIVGEVSSSVVYYILYISIVLIINY
jgi:protein transport protein SEC31